MAANNGREMQDIATCSICQEYFTDARILTCTHYFCLVCLQEFQTTAIIMPCPICRAEAVPAARELHRLPTNRAANEMADVLRKGEKDGKKAPTLPPRRAAPVQSQPQRQQSPRQPPQAASRPAATPPNQPSAARKPSPQPAQISLTDLLLGRARIKTEEEKRAETIAELLGAHAIAQQAQRQRAELQRAQQQRAQQQRAEAMMGALAEAFMGALISDDDDGKEVHRGIHCDECHKENITGIRYKCGICSDFDLCENCEKKPRQLVHNRSHIFLKLKKRGTTQVPQGQVLDSEVFAYGQRMNFNNNLHAVSIRLGPLPIQVSISCDRCGESPIRGTRYKCGICDSYDLCADCEEGCYSFHPSSHVFLVLKHPATYMIPSKRLLRCDFY